MRRILVLFIFAVLTLGCSSKGNLPNWATEFELRNSQPLDAALLAEFPALSGFRVLAEFKGRLDLNHNADELLLLGAGDPVSEIYMGRIALLVRLNGGGWQLLAQPEGFSGGYNARLAALQLERGKPASLFLATATGGSGGYTWYYLFTLQNGGYSLALGPDDFCGLLRLNDSGFTDGRFFLDCEGAEERLSASLPGGYQPEADVKPWLGAPDVRGFVDYDADGFRELELVQQVKGSCNADTIGSVCSFWRLVEGRLVLLSCELL